MAVKYSPSYGNYLNTRMSQMQPLPYAYNKASGKNWAMSEGQDGEGYYTRLTKYFFGVPVVSEKYHYRTYEEMRNAFRRYVAVHH